MLEHFLFALDEIFFGEAEQINCHYQQPALEVGQQKGVLAVQTVIQHAQGEHQGFAVLELGDLKRRGPPFSAVFHLIFEGLA